MIFSSERDLQNKLVSIDLIPDDIFSTTYMREEVPVGECIPDLIYVRFSNPPNPDVLPRKWTYRHTYVIWLLRKWGKLHPKTIAARSYERLERIEPIIEDLINSGSIKKKKTGALTLSEELNLLSAEVISVEVKLKRWRQALLQAEKYKRFSDQVFIAMDADGIPRGEDDLTLFRNLGVGLYAVSTDERNLIIPPGVCSQSKGAEREYLIASAISQARQTL